MCHPYRRKRRSERSHHTIEAVAVAGGWTDFETMLKCYDQPDDADLLAVTSEPRKRRERNGPTNGLSALKKEEPEHVQTMLGLSVAPPGLEPGLS